MVEQKESRNPTGQGSVAGALGGQEAKGRTFEAWKAQIIRYLFSLTKNGDEEFEKEKLALINKANKLRATWTAALLTNLYNFAKKHGIFIPEDLLPTSEEILSWYIQEKRGI